MRTLYSSATRQILTTFAPPVMNAAQAEPSASGEYVELTDKLREAVSARYTAEHDLRAFRRQVASELAEKARMAEVLRQHGLSW